MQARFVTLTVVSRTSSHQHRRSREVLETVPDDGLECLIALMRVLHRTTVGFQRELSTVDLLRQHRHE